MNIVKTLKKVVFFFVTCVYKSLYKHIKVDEKTILFVAHLGRGYLCNPKYVYEYMQGKEEFNDFKYVWALKNPNIEIQGAKVIKYRGLKYFYYLAKSKFWVINSKLPEYCIKKKNQVYIQCWHGTPLKRLAHDISVAEETTFFRSKQTRDEMLKSYDIDVARYNYLLSPNRHSTEKFMSCFNIERERVIETGYPRNDFLVNITEEKIEEIKNRLNIPKDKKVLLYCPTWRDNKFNDKGYYFELKVNFNMWHEKLGNDWVVIFKPHYLIANKFDSKGLEDFLYIFPENYDINELYVVSDILITDYSSTFFDYSILNRPILFYMYDKKEYEEELRGFYLDVNKDLPGPIFENENELIEAIKDKNIFETYKDTLQKFIDQYHEFEDGHASQKVVEKLIIKERLK
ncbi:CDP-glycerol glycerophosphotransferase family protein [Clostridium sp. UBA1353]|uniref:CDP-glycerol glycerophosphotransferase family protein n=1 Tax=Clostridium sp. UBA1353 TaxID=1946347 RepID=UPI003217FD41